MSAKTRFHARNSAPPPLTGSALGWVMELFGGGRLFVVRGEFNDEALLFLIVAVSAEDDGAL